ncbi:MAG: hypothetical protein U0414_30140 [Polyangiaceae bacterium]
MKKKQLSTNVTVAGYGQHAQPQLTPKSPKKGRRRVTLATTVAEVGVNNHNVAVL